MDKFEVLKELKMTDNVDYWSGEIVSQHSYVVCPAPTLPAAPTLGANHTPTSATMMKRMLKMKDGRTLKLVNDVRRIYDADKGDHHYQGKDVSMSNATHDLLNLLVQRIDYRNVILITLTEAAELLSVRRDHVNRKLDTLGGAIRVSGSTEGIKKGDIKIEINPAYGFRYERDAMPTARASAMNSWITTFLKQQ